MELNKPAIAKHFCNPGDAIASLAGIKSYFDQNQRKVTWLQQLNVPATYYPGATHGTVSDTDMHTMVCMNRTMYEMLKPLLLSQEYIHDVDIYNGQPNVLIDIDRIRKEIFVNLPQGQIQAWLMYAYPDLAYDLSKPWINLPDADHPMIEKVKGKILVNFTERYRNAHVNYFFLRKFKHRLLFAGTEKEHLLFVNKWQLDMPRLEVKDFLELAYAIKYCQFLLANQSMCWNLAEAIKSPRILEICEFAPNCMPFVGEKSYGFYHQTGLEHYVDIMTC